MHTQPWYIALAPMTRDSGIITGKLLCLQYQSPFPFFNLTVPLSFIFVMVYDSWFFPRIFTKLRVHYTFVEDFIIHLINMQFFGKHFLLHCFYLGRLVSLSNECPIGFMLVFKMESRPNTSCICVACSVVW
jgi:hypothetical protein